MEEQINTSMNIETPIFKKFKQYLTNKSQFSPKVFNDTPKSLTVFPTVTLKESANVQNLEATTLDRSETINDITDTIEIYAKDMVINGITYPKKDIINELKYLTFNFFDAYGFIRTQASYADYLNYEVNRYVII